MAGYPRPKKDLQLCPIAGSPGQTQANDLEPSACEQTKPFMLARSITECCHKVRPTTPSLLPPPVRPRLPRYNPTTVTLRHQSSSAPEEPTALTHDDTRKQGAAINASHSKPNAPSPTTTTTTTTRHLSIPQLPSAPTALHSSLPTFLAHAARTGVSPTSTTYIGTYYEYAVAQTLRRFGFDLARTGGRGDAGIDLLGTWHLPPQRSPGATGGSSAGPGVLRVLVQCKALKAKLGPNLIRELEGAFVGAPAGYKAGPGGGVLGVLISPREATKGVRDAMGRSRWPMAWVMLEVRRRGNGEERATAADPREGRVRQVLWNKAAREVGLEGLDVTMRYDQVGEGGDGVGKECVLIWQGGPVPGLDEGG